MGRRTTAKELVEEIVATAGVIRATEEPVDLVLTDDEESVYEMGLYFAAAASICVLQDRGMLAR